MRFKRVCACLLTVLMLGTLTVPARADTYFFGAVNYRLFPCVDYYMPVNLSNGVVVPSRLLTNSGLGINSTYDTANRVFTLYDSTRQITFDIGKRITYDSKQQYKQMAFEASGVIYLPLDFICNYFEELTYKGIASDYGTILHLYTRNQVVSDNLFLTVNDSQLERQQTRYRELNGLPALNTGGGVSAQTPTPPPVPAPPPQVTLSIDASDSEYVGAMLDLLDEYGKTATFFVTREAMEQSHVLMRRMASRYTIGILGSDPDWFFESPERMIEELEAANTVLRQATLSQTRLMRAPGGSEPMTTELYGALEESGYLLFDWSVQPQRQSGAGIKPRPESAASELMNRLDKTGDNVIRITCDEYGLSVLSQLLPKLVEENADFLGLSETRG